MARSSVTKIRCVPCAQAKPVSTAASLGQASFMDMTMAVGPSSSAAAAASPGGSTAARVSPGTSAVASGPSAFPATLAAAGESACQDWSEESNLVFFTVVYHLCIFFIYMCLQAAGRVWRL